MGGCAEDGEGEEGFVDLADFHAGGVAPGVGCAGCEDCVPHAIAGEAETGGPDYGEDDIGEEGEGCGEAEAAVDDYADDSIEEGEDAGDDELGIAVSFVCS